MDITLVVLSTLLFALQFFFQQMYSKKNGNSFAATLDFLIISGVAGALLLLCKTGFSIGFSGVTFLLASIYGASCFIFSYCSLKSFAYVNLSVYSVFAMLGGMLLPALYGILFVGEDFTWQIAVCFALVFLAMVLTVERGKTTALGFLFYFLVFVMNGMSGVLSKLHNDSPAAVSADSYLFWSKVTVVAAALLLRLLFFRRVRMPHPSAVWQGAGYAVLTTFGNLFLLIALETLPASVQYPLVTGGVMVFSTAISLIRKEKVTVKQLVSTALALASTVFIIL